MVNLKPGPFRAGSLTVRYRRLLRTARAVVLSGSLPLGVPPDAYGQLVALAVEARVPAVLDAEGPALLAGLAAGPALIKPNAAELAATAGPVDPLTGARLLRAAGARAVVVSLGPGGLLASTPEGDWRARPPEDARGNPTGAGDSAVAALTAGLVAGTPWPERLAEAVALSAATVLAPLAGSFDPADRSRLRPLVRVEPVHPPGPTPTRTPSPGPEGGPHPA
ncbi:1-phosphofructokinase family hexose kinase [Kitasatospora sp. NPDC098652]|uniref:1-phosphofructokinase family hexose kinase n=1 Tax=Kitasatospora sp. NPDC098652 TaxID=3364095 RepID=UPI0037F8A041